MKVIAMLGGPGSGKSTTAAGVFHKLKLAGVNCELVTEFAKDLSYEKRGVALGNQAYVFGKQLHRLHRLDGTVDVVITDSPPILSLMYAPDWYPPSFADFVRFMVGRYETSYYFMDRVKPFVQTGRHHTEEESIDIDWKIKELFEYNTGYPKYKVLPGDETAVDSIVKDYFA